MNDSLSGEKCSEILKAIADQNRLLIIQALRERPQNVSDLSALLDLDIGTVSHHLKVLRNQELVSKHRKGKELIYSLSKSMFKNSRSKNDKFDFGCCCLELPKEA